MKRQYVIFAFALIALLGSAVALLGAIRDRQFALRGYVDATQDANLPFALPRLGVNAELTQYRSEELETHLRRMDSAHIVWVRQQFRWDQIEPEKGRLDWSQPDRLVAALDRHPNLRLIAVLVNSPTWARNPQSPDDPTAPPDDPADFAAFAKAFAARYAQAIDHYQVWDEQNLITGWGGLNPQPADYVALLQAAYTAIHAADETATVIAGGLSPTVETGPANISDILYLRHMYAYAAKDYMDGVGAKPHGFNLPATDRTVDPNVLNFSRIVALREEMVRQGDGTKALWASSWGWNYLPDDWKGRPSIWGSVTTDEQVVHTLAALDRAEREWPWLAGMTLQHWQPNAAQDDPIWGFALIDQQGNPSPLWSALVERSAADAASNGLFPAINPYARYSGVWTLTRFGADIGWLRDSQLDFHFDGTDVALLLRRDNYVAYLYPTVDGQPANATPYDAGGNAYIVLTSGRLEPELTLVPVARDLPPDLHTLHVVADRGWDRWALAGYAVSSGDLGAPYSRQIAVAVLTILVSAISATLSAWQIDWRPMLQPLARFWLGINATGQLVIGAVTSLALAAGMLLTWGDGAPNFLRRDAVQLGISIITAGLIYIEPAFVLTLAAAIIQFIVIYNRLDIGLMLTIFWAPFFLFPVELFRFAFPMVEMTVLLLGAAWTLRMLGRWGRSRQSAVSQFPATSILHKSRQLKAADYAVIAWVILGSLSLLWAYRLPQAITELRAVIVEPALFYVVGRTSGTDRRTLCRLVDTLLLAGFVVSIVGLVNFLNPALRITAEGGAQRLTSVYGSPNNVGLFLGRCIPFALALLAVKTDHRRQLAAGAMLLVMSFAVILSQSAGALFLGIPASVVAVALLVWRRRALPFIAGLAVVGLIGLFVALQFPRFSRIFDLSEGTSFFRLRLWQSSLDLIGDYPLTGVGLDQFLYAYRGQYIRPDAEAEPSLSHPHNVVLDFWVRLGMGGVLVLVWMQFAFWRGAWSSYQRFLRAEPLYFALSVGAIGSMIDLLAHGMIDNSVYVIDLAFVLMFLLALSASLQNIRAIDGESVKMV